MIQLHRTHFKIASLSVSLLRPPSSLFASHLSPLVHSRCFRVAIPGRFSPLDYGILSIGWWTVVLVRFRGRRVLVSASVAAVRIQSLISLEVTYGAAPGFVRCASTDYTHLQRPTPTTNNFETSTHYLTT